MSSESGTSRDSSYGRFWWTLAWNYNSIFAINLDHRETNTNQNNNQQGILQKLSKWILRNHITKQAACIHAKALVQKLLNCSALCIKCNQCVESFVRWKIVIFKVTQSTCPISSTFAFLWLFTHSRSGNVLTSYFVSVFNIQIFVVRLIV